MTKLSDLSIPMNLDHLVSESELKKHPLIDVSAGKLLQIITNGPETVSERIVPTITIKRITPLNETSEIEATIKFDSQAAREKLLGDETFMSTIVKVIDLIIRNEKKTNKERG